MNGLGTHRCYPWFFAFAVLAAVWPSIASAQPTFSVSHQGPSGQYGDPILSAPIIGGATGPIQIGVPRRGPFSRGPNFVLSGISLGFTGSESFEVDAFSYGRDAARLDADLTLYFSVDEFATGVRDDSPFRHLADEGVLGSSEASADVFVNTATGNLLFMPPPGFGGPPELPSGAGNRIFLDGDGVFSSGRDGLALTEPNPVSPYNPVDEGDDLDALDIDTVEIAVENGPIFFSLDSSINDPFEGDRANLDSARNAGGLAGQEFGGGDVMVIAPRTEYRYPEFGTYASSGTLGLNGSADEERDDLDALAVWDDGALNEIDDPFFTPGIDVLLFSVRRGSEIIGSGDFLHGAPIEPGDVLMDPVSAARALGLDDPPPGTPPAIAIAAEYLGLGTERSGTAVPVAGSYIIGDDLNALDIVPEPAGVTIAMIGLIALSNVRARRRRGRSITKVEPPRTLEN